MEVEHMGFYYMSLSLPALELLVYSKPLPRINFLLEVLFYHTPCTAALVRSRYLEVSALDIFILKSCNENYILI